MSKKRNKNSRKKQLKIRKLKNRSNRKNSTSILETLDYKITKNPVDDSDIRALPEDIQDQIEDIYNRVFTTPDSTIDELKELISTYPHIPQLYNYLYAAYSYTGYTKKAIEVMKQNYKINPTYLFAKLNYVEHYIQQGDLNIVNKVFDNKLELRLLYPERDTFHDTEVIGFYGVIGLYNVMKKQYDSAKKCLQILEAISPTHQHTQRLRELLFANSNLLNQQVHR